MREYRALAIASSAIPDAIAFAVGQRPEVDADEIIVGRRPARALIRNRSGRRAMLRR
jgi:hypothetical protein